MKTTDLSIHYHHFIRIQYPVTSIDNDIFLAEDDTGIYIRFRDGQDYCFIFNLNDVLSKLVAFVSGLPGTDGELMGWENIERGKLPSSCEMEFSLLEHTPVPVLSIYSYGLHHRMCYISMKAAIKLLPIIQGYLSVED